MVLSFAGEDRLYVEKVAKYLKEKEIKVFYDKYEKLCYGAKIYTFIYMRFTKRKRDIVLCFFLVIMLKNFGQTTKEKAHRQEHL